MSEELRRGIPKGITIGYREVSEEERKKSDEEFEKILKRVGVLKPDESIKDMRHL